MLTAKEHFPCARELCQALYFNILFNPQKSGSRYCCHSHLTEETEAWRSYLTYAKLVTTLSSSHGIWLESHSSTAFLTCTNSWPNMLIELKFLSTFGYSTEFLLSFWLGCFIAMVTYNHQVITSVRLFVILLVINCIYQIH